MSAGLSIPAPPGPVQLFSGHGAGQVVYAPVRLPLPCDMIRVCFVCLGNICRSPTAEGVMRHLVARRGLEVTIHVDSAGTSAYHVGEPPDRRSAEAARRRGISLLGRSRQFEQTDFQQFDYVVAMDTGNRRDLLALARSELDAQKVSLLRDFDPLAPPGSSVPDPYYGGSGGFDEVLDMCERGCERLLDDILKRLGGAS